MGEEKSSVKTKTENNKNTTKSNDKDILNSLNGGKKKVKWSRVLKVTILIVLISIAGIYVYANSILNDVRDTSVTQEIGAGLKESNVIADIFKPAEKQINFVIYGLDKDDIRTDLMMIGTFSSDDKTIDIISVPRDIKISLTDEEIAFLKKKNRPVPSKEYIKLTELFSYPGEEMGVDFVTAKLEDMFNVEFAYYALLDIDGFRALVNAMGGVEFDVPQRMWYEDYPQDLYIDLYPGLQILDGTQAEGLIRYRGTNDGYEHISPNYKMPDIERNAVQRDFLRAFILQLLAKETILGNASDIVSTVKNNVSTNFNINEVPKYLNYIKDINTDNIRTHYIPIIPIKIDGTDFLEINEDDAKTVINKVFYGIAPDPIPSEGKKIQIINATSKAGVASAEKERLEEKDIEVINIDDNDEVLEETFIYVKKDGMGQDLLEFFPEAEIVIDESMEYFEIKIIVGTDSIQ